MDNVTTSNVKTAVKLDHKHDVELSLVQRAVNAIAAFCGSIPFIVIHLVLFILWIAYNTLASNGFDPYPYTFLTMTVSLEAILLSSILLINQNSASLKSDHRHMLDLQVNMLTEQENTAMLRVIDKIAKKIGVDSSELADYLEDTKHEEVLEALEKEDKDNGVQALR